MVRGAHLIAWYLPMHTATRLALPVIERVRLQATAHLCAYGLYAPLNEARLRSAGIDTVLGGEFEAALVAVADGVAADATGILALAGAASSSHGEAAPTPRILPLMPVAATHARDVPRLAFITPDRAGLPPLKQYATLHMPDGTRRLVGTTEATRGCKHLCRHCPIVPIYNGTFRVIPADVVLDDVRAQVEAGAQHITFADPDFLNGPTHAVRIVRALAERFPGISYDVTAKVEHLLKHRDLLPTLASTGCAFVTSAAESVDDDILARLQKGHTRADFVEAVAICRAVGLELVPTFVAFTPWTSLDGYIDLLGTIASLDLVDHVSAIQLAIRLLITSGSRLLELPDIATLVEDFQPATLTYPWQHPDARVDELQRALSEMIGTRLDAPRREVFERVWELAHAHAGRSAPSLPRPGRDRATVPYLNEPWYC